MADVTATPMMTQYRELKRRFPDHLLLFRLGDFYELFLEDAELGSRLLSITLTARQGAPMAGIPHHAAEGYIARLVQAGQKIAICEQLEGGGKGKKLLRRDVVRVITPGTLTDTAYLSGTTNNFLMALGRTGASTGVALLDVSTGEFWVGEDGPGEDAVLAAALLRRPAEVVLPESAADRVGATGATAGRRRHPHLRRSRPVERPARRDGALQPLRCDDARCLRGGGSPRGAAGGGRGARLRARHAGRSARSPGSPAALAPGRLPDARRDRGAHARAAGGQRRDRAQLALRRARRDRHPDGRAPAAPVAAAAAARPRRHRRPPGCRRRAGRRARGARRAPPLAQAGGRPRAPHEPGHPRRGPRARPRRAARLPGPARRGSPGYGRADGTAPGRGPRGAGRPRRSEGHARGRAGRRAAADAAGRPDHSRDLERRAGRDRPATPPRRAAGSPGSRSASAPGPGCRACACASTACSATASR